MFMVGTVHAISGRMNTQALDTLSIAELVARVKQTHDDDQRAAARELNRRGVSVVGIIPTVTVPIPRVQAPANVALIKYHILPLPGLWAGTLSPGK